VALAASRTGQYLVALAATAAAVLLHAVLDPWLGEAGQLSTLYGAVAVAVWVGGLGAAVLAAVSGLIVSEAWFAARPISLAAAITYAVSCSIIIALGHEVRRRAARARGDSAERRTLESEPNDLALQALAASRANFNLLADAMPQLVWTARADGVVDYYSARRAAYYGAQATPDEWQCMVHPDELEATREAWHRASSTGVPYEIEHRVRMADGTYRWHLSRALPAFDHDGRIARWYGTATDIDRLKRAEGELALATASLRRKRERLAVALRAGRMGIYEWQTGTSQVWWSRELYDVFGIDPASFVPTLETCTALVVPEDRAELWRRTEDCLERRGELIHEYRVSRPDGQVRWLQVQAHVTTAPDGAPAYLTGVAFDVTERKRAEEQLLEADRRKDRFIATLAHELRNPLAPIRNAVRLLAPDAQGRGDPTWARDVIERQVAQMARLLDDLLDISRISRDRVELQIGRVTLASVVDMAVETSQPAIERSRHELVVSVPPEPIWLEADAVRLAQVLSNLLNNAAKYTEPGGHIRLTASRAEAELVVSVADDGIGIAPEMHAAVFDMFSQAKPAIERSQGGLGIGLSLARGLVEAMGGRIAVRSEGIGCGSEFTVRLPLVTSVEAQASESLRLEFATPTTGAGRPCVVIADDLVDGADSLGLLLQAHGYQVGTAYDGEQAVRLCAQLRPDVVLLDIGMPVLDGYQACDRIRAQPGGADAFIVALTGWGEENAPQRAAATGFDLHMVKPVDVDTLLDVLASRRRRDAGQVSRCSLRGQSEASTVAR
jgi:PAS domain S-box-containing protein